MMGGLETMLAAFVAGAMALLGLIFKARSDGRKLAEREAMADRLNTIRQADEIEQAVAGNDPAANRKELSQWAKR